MVTLTNAENALKTVYLGAVTELLNTKANPLLGKIEQTSVDVWGKEVRTAARVGINGGIGAATRRARSRELTAVTTFSLLPHSKTSTDKSKSRTRR